MKLVELCKHCETCKDYVYDSKTSQGNRVTFKYCAGVKEVVDSHKWRLHDVEWNRKYVTTSIHNYDAHVSYFLKHNRENIIKYLNGPQDLRLRFMREVYKVKQEEK